jgi:archaellum component FlaF (FlaF/FlaG flagellin family)
MKGFTQLSLAALAAYASATAINKRESPLSVVLTTSGNSEVKVAVTNNGDKTLNLLSKGTFLDEVNPVEKVSMYSAGGSKCSFDYIISCQPIRMMAHRKILVRSDTHTAAIIARIPR